MTTRGRALRFTAVSALVVLTLTGFSTGRGHGGGSGDGGGGGCSSSGQDHDSSSSSSSGGGGYRDHDYDDDTDDDETYGSGGGGSDSTPYLQDATVELVTCATKTTPYATVEVTNPNTTEGTFTVTVDFLDAAGDPVDSAYTDVTVPAGTTKTAEVQLDETYLPLLDHCEPAPEASPAA
ncbi:hypothetical protein H0H10_37660 [Streptomyces sp. TRM S81-3]|uniref:Uncharacterized protein n=1 Tax=Streptomyces griseicoloratus TaxID=2752516 RepID=A0A926LC74_9ACTN|nr:hypothetical protein [Streptomyces griseicoloratus]MBD0424834.1 hypothetical protein [Streptomyces griseicoloratus]